MPKVDGTHFGYGKEDRKKGKEKSVKTGKPVAGDKSPHEGGLVRNFGDRRTPFKTKGTGAATKGLNFHRYGDDA